jgi:phosphate transport system substrate-binding protein
VAGVLDNVALDRGSIALLPVVPTASAGVRALLVTAVAGGVAFGPSPENIATGDYPLRLPLELLFRAEDATKVAPVVAFFASEEGAGMVERSLLVPLPARNRAQLAAEFGR